MFWNLESLNYANFFFSIALSGPLIYLAKYDVDRGHSVDKPWFWFRKTDTHAFVMPGPDRVKALFLNSDQVFWSCEV